ncbi:AraC family transcriptional regulator [Halioglobus pacificus]|uniref:Transcriptional regulator n=1 Tax=Parahalioglobus pacificus TaxID=930806 RepID=A0A919CIQ4_9GAMM|nr:AraC family transcriptional regulator [Halioglobus pacificus]GHD27848.1 transcriptional regulator [Halioglobus pacificus]
MRNPSISVAFARRVLANAVSAGLDPSQLLRDCQISPRLLRDDSARIPMERYADLQVAAMVAMDDESLGYGSRRIPVGCWNMMCHAVIGCETLGQAMSRYCRFFQLFELDLQTRFEAEGDTCSITLVGDIDAASANLVEMYLFNCHRFCSWLAQEHLPLLQVNLSYTPAATQEDYRRMFLANPVAFEQPDSELIMPRAVMDKPVKQTQQSLRHFLRHPVLILLTQRYDQDSWTQQVRDRVRHNLVHMPELANVAADLDVHPQTLRRRLTAEGTTFKDIKNQLRRDTALYFLGKKSLSIEEIAHRAGFSESSAFIRAFKGWTGVTPYSYRKGL